MVAEQWLSSFSYPVFESIRDSGTFASVAAGGRQGMLVEEHRLRALVLRDTARHVGIGLAAGLVLVVLGARVIRSLLYRVEPLDPAVLVTISAMILGLALVVSLRPAFEASRLDLTRSLRDE